MIDHIGTKAVSIRQIAAEGIAIRLLDKSEELKLTAAEWFDLVGLVEAIKSAVDFQDGYHA